MPTPTRLISGTIAIETGAFTPTTIQPFHQNDSAIQVDVQFTQNGAPYNIPSGVNARLHLFYADRDLSTAKQTMAVSSDRATYQLSETDTSVNGVPVIVIRLIDNTGISLVVSAIPIQIIRADGSLTTPEGLQNIEAAVAAALAAADRADQAAADAREVLAEIAETDMGTVIAELANKLDKESVVNNLTTTEEGYALDARQGKELNDSLAGKATAAQGEKADTAVQRAGDQMTGQLVTRDSSGNSIPIRFLHGSGEGKNGLYHITGDTWYFMVADTADGYFNSLRPLYINMDSGRVIMGNGLTLSDLMLNMPLPIMSGGTGANTAQEGYMNLAYRGELWNIQAALDPGCYETTPVTIGTFPTSTGGVASNQWGVLVVAKTASYAIQTWYPAYMEGSFMVRKQWGDGVWTGWYRYDGIPD